MDLYEVWIAPKLINMRSQSVRVQLHADSVAMAISLVTQKYQDACVLGAPFIARPSRCVRRAKRRLNN